MQFIHRLKDRVFLSIYPSLSRGYRNFFAVDEIEASEVLQWMCGASLLFFYAAFNRWIGLSAGTVESIKANDVVCWPFFQKCSELYFLSGLPYGYSQNIFYMVLYALMALAVWGMWRKNWNLVHLLLFLLLLWEIFFVFALSYVQAAPYHYYHIALTGILLFARYKEYFLKLGFVFMYFLSATIKYDDGWVLGTYFTSLQNGLPIFPDALTPLITNLVIFMQTIGAWFLLSKKSSLRYAVLAYFMLFHLYSIIFVQYFYPTTALPPLLILFGPLYRHTDTPYTWKATRGWFILFLLLSFQVAGFLPGLDRRLTLEANRFGMYMFEANHQCVATIKIYRTGPIVDPTHWEVPAGTPCQGFFCEVRESTYSEGAEWVRERRYESATAWNRCDPYEWWERYHSQCAINPGIMKIAFQFDHSINGGPFYRIVDLPNICDVTYLPFVHNDWIHVPPGVPIVGYPVKNSYHY